MSKMAKRPELLIMSGEKAGTRFKVDMFGVRLGRSSSNDIAIPDEELSRNHCIFESSGDEGVQITDLASANGTFVNGEQLGAEPRALSVGDEIVAGSIRISVVGEGENLPVSAPAGEVDLGLGGSAREFGDSAAPQQRRRPLVNLLWIFAAAVLAGAIAVIMFGPSSEEAKVVSVEKPENAAPELTGLYYEKIEADARRVFRYEMTIDSSGTLRVAFDDVPGENRRVDKTKKLSPQGIKRIMEILGSPGFDALEDVYSGGSAADENALRSRRLRVVRWNDIKDVLAENTQEPEALKTVCEALETFSRNELGIWAIQYSSDKLIEMSAESERSADAKWEEREVEYGNLSAAVKAWKEAVFYLDTISPKPEGYAELKEKLAKGEEELSRRYKDQRFLADKAINLGDWEQAQAELKILCELVPEKDDPRHSEANAKLVDVENRMKKSKGGR